MLDIWSKGKQCALQVNNGYHLLCYEETLLLWMQEHNALHKASLSKFENNVNRKAPFTRSVISFCFTHLANPWLQFEWSKIRSYVFS